MNDDVDIIADDDDDDDDDDDAEGEDRPQDRTACCVWACSVEIHVDV